MKLWTLVIGLMLTLCSQEPAVSQSMWASANNFKYQISPNSKVNLSLDQKELQVSSGDVLVDSFGNTRITSPYAIIDCTKHSLVLIFVGNNTERCLVLCDNGPSAVTIHLQHAALKLLAGQEAFISNFNPQFEQIMHDYPIGRRKIKLRSFSSTEYITTSEFSMLQALKRIPILSTLSTSTDADDLKLHERILKTAAVLDLMTGSHGAFTDSVGF